MKPITKEEFFRVVGPLDVNPTIITDRYPSTSEWRFPRQNRPPIGRSVGRIEGGLKVTDYFLA